MIEGRLTDVTLELAGSEFVADVAAGATTATVQNPDDFNSDSGGVARVGGEGGFVVGYDVDLDTAVLTFDTPLPSGYAAGTRVDLYPLVEEQWAWIQEEEDEDGEMPARVPERLRDVLPLGLRDEDSAEMVEAEYRGDDLVLLDVLYQSPQVDGSFLADASVAALAIGSVNAGVIQGTITAGQIGSITAAQITGLIQATQINSIAAGQITGSILASQIGSVNASAITGSISAGQIGSVNASAITGTITASQIGSVNATVISGLIQAAQINTVAAGQITGSITASQIGSVNATAITGSISAGQIGSVNATAITGSITSGQIGSVAASTITVGTIASTQIGSVNAATITVGTISAAQIGSVAASTITGSITSGQIASVAATTITGSITSGQIASVAASTITGSIASTQIGSVNAATITVGTIASTQIGSINAATITVGHIVASQITSVAASTITGTITSGQIASVAASTITGGITSGQITSVAASTITGAVTAGQLSVTQLSDVAANLGTITAGSISGATITGGTIRTSASNPRVEMTSAGLKGYNGAGTVTLNFDTATGNLTLTGVVTASAGSSVPTTVLAGQITAGQFGGVVGGGNVARNSNYAANALTYTDDAGQVQGFSSQAGTWVIDALAATNRPSADAPYAAKTNTLNTQHSVNTIENNSNFAAAPGQRWTVSAWGQGVTDGTGTLLVRLIFLDSGGAILSTTDSAAVACPTGTWTRVISTATAPASTAQVRAAIRPLSSTTTQLRHTAVQLEMGDVATAYSPRADEIIPGTVTKGMIASVNASVLNGLVQAAQINTVTAGQITGSITSGQIGSVAASTITGSITSGQIGSVAASTITGSIVSGQIGSVAASTITGSIVSTQIGSVNAATITVGTIASTQIGSVNAATITVGSIAATQITSLTAGQITGSIVSGQITSITAGQITGSIVSTQIGSVNASTISVGTIASTQIGSVNAATITVGTIASTQIGSVNAATISVGTLSSTQIGSVNAATITAGLIQGTQINTVAASQITGSISAAQITSITAGQITGSITAGQITSITAGQITLVTGGLDSISTNAGTLTAGIMKSAAGVTWAGTTAGFILSATDGGMRAFNGTQGTYELRGSDGAISVGALLGSGLQRIEILPVGMSLYEGASAVVAPPTTGGGANAALTWTTLYIAAVGATQSLISSVSNVVNPTVTTAAAHGLVAGDIVEIRGLTGAGAANVNGYRTVASAPTGTTFTITMAAPGAITASTGAVVKVTPKGQFTTGSDTSASRMWFDYQGLHSQYQNAGLNQGSVFRTFDFNPADASGLRLHTDTTPDAIRISPTNGISFKLAQAGDPNADLAARWLRQGNGALAARFWGDNINGDDVNNGQMNAYAYATSSGTAQVVTQSQVGTGSSPTIFANISVQANLFGTASGITVRAVQGAADTGNLSLITTGGGSHWVQGVIQGGTGITVTNGAGGLTVNPSVAIDTTVVPRLSAANSFTGQNTFTAQTNIQPTADIVPFRVFRGTDSAPTADLTRWLNNAGSSVLAVVKSDGAGQFDNGGVITKTVAGTVSDLNFSNPASGHLAVDTSNTRLYVRVGGSWKYAGLGTAPTAAFNLPTYAANRTATAPASVSLAELARTVYTLIDDLKTRGELP